jgi:aerobic-type carbon monoxide dehydrogenase small subunit (CoxS/CutS family)
MRTEFTLNGRTVAVQVEPRELLGHVLRERLGCRGVHVACGQGFCGACTVLLDGGAVRSCLMLAPQVGGRDVRTIADVADDDAPGGMHPLQAALKRAGAVQCGYCTAGIVLSLLSLLEENAAPGRVEIEDALGGHICRCTGYSAIVDAALDHVGATPRSDGQVQP